MNSFCVLIIDDDEATRDVFGEYLRLAGFEVAAAASGRAALELVESARPDVILLDLQMPEMDGFSTLAALRETQATAETPVLFLTALDRPYLKIKGLEAGADDYINKTCDRAELLARIRVAVRRSQRFRRTVDAMQGRLDALKLADILQVLDIGNRSATVHLPELGAQVVVHAGTLVDARWQEFTGEAALQRVLLLEHGTFSVRFDVEPAATASPAVPLTLALMRASAVVDEVRQKLDALPIGGETLLAAADGSNWPRTGVLRRAQPLSAATWVASMKNDLRENAGEVSEALARGAVRVVADT